MRSWLGVHVALPAPALPAGDQPGLHGQFALERGAGELRLQRPGAIHHAVNAAYVQRARQAASAQSPAGNVTSSALPASAVRASRASATGRARSVGRPAHLSPTPRRPASHRPAPASRRAKRSCMCSFSASNRPSAYSSARSGAPPANSQQRWRRPPDRVSVSSHASACCPRRPRDRELLAAAAHRRQADATGCDVIRISRLSRRRLLERLEHAVRGVRRHLMRGLDDGDLVALPYSSCVRRSIAARDLIDGDRCLSSSGATHSRSGCEPACDQRAARALAATSSVVPAMRRTALRTPATRRTSACPGRRRPAAADACGKRCAAHAGRSCAAASARCHGSRRCRQQVARICQLMS